ncbi:unnamed protein product [Closterium sp. Naga37s-1]|nr:unnamed protein product [Closterium sp. Naga37s-1]
MARCRGDRFGSPAARRFQRLPPSIWRDLSACSSPWALSAIPQKRALRPARGQTPPAPALRSAEAVICATRLSARLAATIALLLVASMCGGFCGRASAVAVNYNDSPFFRRPNLELPLPPSRASLHPPNALYSYLPPSFRFPPVTCKCSPSPGAALLSLRAELNITVPASRTPKALWVSRGSCDDLYGVRCDEHGSVTSLLLYSVTGTLPSAIGNLTALTTLSVSSNLSCPLPSSLTTLTALVNLHLGRNSLSCSLPPWLTTLSKLKILSIEWNKITGSIPAGISALSSLSAL